MSNITPSGAKEKIVSLPFIVKLPLVLISLIALGYLAKLGQTILAPFFTAFLLAMLFIPFANFLEAKLRFRRGISTFSCIFLLFLTIAGISYFFGDQLSALSNDWGAFKNHIDTTISQLQEWIHNTFHINPTKQMKYVNEGSEKILSGGASMLGVTLGVFSSGLAFFAFTLLFLMFILLYRRGLYKFIVSVFKDEHHDKVTEIVTEIQLITKQYISGVFLQALIVATLTTIGLSIVGVKYAILIGVMTGILNIVPYIGIFVSLIIASLISFATGGASHLLFVLIVYIVVHAIDGNILLPFIVGSKVKINALFSLLALLIGESMWGISGMFLCIPLLAIAKIIFDRVDSLKPWGALIGEEESEKSLKRNEIIRKRLLKARLRKFQGE